MSKGHNGALATALTLCSMFPGSAVATDFTAGVVIERMDEAQRYTFVAGIVEGLAYARFVSDGKNEEPGMKCIYQWFYDEDGSFDTILAAYAKFPEHLPGAVTGALIQRRCGS